MGRAPGPRVVVEALEVHIPAASAAFLLAGPTVPATRAHVSRLADFFNLRKMGRHIMLLIEKIEIREGPQGGRLAARKEGGMGEWGVRVWD